ncbi:hypothetical protein C5O23_12730 [Duncaniella muris]|uniref:DUF6850 domain-containing protein n=2 Tax=Duncaniella muris TaxID=2094150 RepID=A0A2V1ILX2_9BACT|nr:DUF6850 family outer membrane beta-barrel protein [Duncaniella muris]PWB00461.1 hypothetical protein C5O23_12730 [Duncaniella muris]
MSEVSGFQYSLAIIAVAMIPSFGVMAQPLSLSELQRLSQPVNAALMQRYESNPAAMLFRDSVSLSSFAISGEYDRQDKPVMEQLGDGSDLLGVSAGSYTRLGAERVVWGNASFVTGTYRSVRWTDYIDYNRVAPYVLGDEAGGDLSTRSYRFSGGYACGFSRWTVGVHAAYRAEIAYRNRDPRVKTVVSDIDIALGGGYTVNDHSVIGLNAGVNIYNQNCDLDFYNPLNEINTYTLTGMGTYYRRFMGNANKNSGYSSFGYNIGFQWLPVSGQGFAATIGYTGYRMEQQLRNYNNLTLGYTGNDIIDLGISYRLQFGGGIMIQPTIDGNMFRRKGTENIFGSSAGSSYDRIGSSSPYRFESSHFGLSFPVRFEKGNSSMTLTPDIAYESEKESYADPLRRLGASHVISGFDADFSAVSGKSWLWNLSAGVSYAKADPKEEILTDLEPDTPLGQCVLSNYSMLKADRTAFNVSAGISRPVMNFIVSLRVAYRLTDYIGEGLRHGAAVTLAAEF